MRHINGRQDPSLTARVVNCTPLLYRAGPDESFDRPAHVRAASSLAAVGDYLAVIQDDANFIAWFDASLSNVEVVPLPAGHEGKRLFDDGRGNKQWKLDLEACLFDAAGQRLFAFGSGSSPLRERIVTVTNLFSQSPTVTVHEAAAFYAALRAATDFAGSELNIEGAILLDETRLRLFQRGNGAPHGSLRPVNATADLSWDKLLAYLQTPQKPASFALENINQYNLGTIDDVPLTFTDAALVSSGVIFSAAAEASPDAIQDGPVAGSALGLIKKDAVARWTVLLDPDGRAFTGKVEGVSVTAAGNCYVVIDKDDPQIPSELCQVELLGSW